MSYVDAVLSPKDDLIHVIERDKDGQRRYVTYPTNYVLYYPDPRGKYRSIFGDPLTKVSNRRKQDFEKEKRIHSDKTLFESDVNVVFRCLSENYLGAEPPKLHVCYFDIESGFEKDSINGEVGMGRGFAPTDDPFNEITAITVYLDWVDQCITLAMPPDHMSDETANDLIKDIPNTILFRDEVEMFEAFFSLIEDADILTGWNSEGYDIPYLINRCKRIMSNDDTRKFCLLGQKPKARKYERFGKEDVTYDLVGRVHMDYLQLYKKYNYESRHSYSLDAIGEMEVGERKVPYEGNLDQLYNKDFRKFIEYNRQDVMLMVKINNKLQFMDLANAIAHDNTVLLPTVMGSVAMIEMAIINEAHSRDLIVPNKVRHLEDELPAPGAYVATPKTGMHEYIGAVDISSLYPSTIRALNMSPETIVAQIRPTLTDKYLYEKSQRLATEKKRYKEGDDGVFGAILWEDMFGTLEYTAIMNQEKGTFLWVDYEDGRKVEMSAEDVWEMVFNPSNGLMISANGTIFTIEKEGVIPGLLSRWYAERKELQKNLAITQEIVAGIQINETLAKDIKSLLGQ